MKIYIKNMVCRGTKLFVIQELKRLGFEYNAFELGMIDFKNKLSLNEITKLAQSLRKYGLELIFRDNSIVTEIRCLIQDLVDNDVRIWDDFSNYLIRKVGYNYAYLSMYFKLETGFSIENYYLEKISEKSNQNISTRSEMLNTLGSSA